MLKTFLTILLVTQISCVIDCTNVLEKDDADFYFTDNLV